MKHTARIFFFAAALLGAAPAFAAEAMPKQVAVSPDQYLARQQQTESDAVKAYNSGVNPLYGFRGTGVYDQEDAFKGPNGFMLPGTYMNNGDSNAQGG